MELGVETRRLREEIESSLTRAFDPVDVLPRLARLARLAAPSSDDGVFAHRQLAELLVERHPWRAALYARRALTHRHDDDRAWAVLAFSQTLLGNFRCAATAYRNALAVAPSNPWYAHNLGHLLDVGLGTPERALPWLRSAYEAKGHRSEFVASYVHALGRANCIPEARRVLEHALTRFVSRELEALLRWVEQGAPARIARSETSRSTAASRSTPAKASHARPGKTLARTLARGLVHLPLDAQQRERALTLARDVVAPSVQSEPARRLNDTSAHSHRTDVAGLAAAVAYAIVYVDHVPLSHAEVAAPFRVGVGRLRGRFAEIRARLDIIRGDIRYASPRVAQAHGHMIRKGGREGQE